MTSSLDWRPRRRQRPTASRRRERPGHRRTWHSVDLETGNVTNWPIATVPTDDPVTSGRWRSADRSADGLVLHAFLRGEVLADDATSGEVLDAQFGADGRLYLTTFGEGLLRSPSAVP